MNKPTKVSYEAKLSAVRRLECEEDGLYFASYFFKQRFGSKMIRSGHHRSIQAALDKVLTGEIKRLIINLPPGYTKTELAVINFIARGLALNPKARFLHLSYSDQLALENSTTIRAIVKSEEYQRLWNYDLKADSDSKKKWWTESGGGIYATSAAGQVTGFRAGHMDPGFSGAIIIDDPVKPDDGEREERRKVNERFNNTIKSRLAHENVPIIVIMQRIHKNDLSGYLLRGGSGDKWDHLNLPVKISKNMDYNKEYTHGRPINTHLKPGWLWSDKHKAKDEKSLKAHKRTWFSQYMQRPEDYVLTGGLWTQNVINANRRTTADIADMGGLLNTIVSVDPSGDDGAEDNGADEIGLVSLARGEDGHYYVLRDDSMNGSPLSWATKTLTVYDVLNAEVIVYEKNYGGAMVKHTLESAEGGELARIRGVVASKSKILRAEPVAALYERNMIHHVGIFEDLEEEMTEFAGTGKSPNRLDALVQGITYLSQYATAEQTAPDVAIFN